MSRWLGNLRIVLLAGLIIGVSGCGTCTSPFLNGAFPERVLVAGMNNTRVRISTFKLLDGVGLLPKDEVITFTSPQGKSFDITSSEALVHLAHAGQTIPFKEGDIIQLTIPSAALTQQGFGTLNISGPCGSVNATLQILPTPLVLAQGTVGVPLAFSLADFIPFTNVATFDTWTALSGTTVTERLPDGLRLVNSQGLISIQGTPAKAGNFRFQLQAVASKGSFFDEEPGSPFTQTFDVTMVIVCPSCAPKISAVSPNNAAAGGGQFTLEVDGTNFVPDAAVEWNGSGRLTTFVSPTVLRATIPASDIAAAGTASVTVFDAGLLASPRTPSHSRSRAAVPRQRSLPSLPAASTRVRANFS